MPVNPETAVSYAALILADEGVEVTPDKLQTLLKAAGVEVEPIWSRIFYKALKNKNIKEILTTVTTAKDSKRGDEKAPEPDSILDKDMVDDGSSSESGSDIGLGLFD